MILLYTGAGQPNDAQNLPEKSLGGYVSSTMIPNGMVNSIFSTIAKSTIDKNKRDTRLIALKNTTGADLTNVNIWINKNDNSYSNVKLAAVASATDSSNNPYFEQIPNPESLPYQAVLSLHATDTPIAVGDLSNGQVIGIWLSREIDANAFPSTAGLTDAAILAMKNEAAGQIVIEDNCDLRITWT